MNVLIDTDLNLYLLKDEVPQYYSSACHQCMYTRLAEMGDAAGLRSSLCELTVFQQLEIEK